MLTTLQTVTTLARYGLSIVPHARREIRRWAGVAAAIPDPLSRSYATEAITVDASNAEAVAALAAIAPRRQRRTAVELLVAYQVLVDYIDTLGERLCADRLVSGLELGVALAAAIASPTSRLEVSPPTDDGGYLVALVRTCRVRFWQLPSAATVERHAHVAAVRCAHALAYTHTATRHSSTAELQRWTTAQTETVSYTWWEIAAGGNSSIAILALLAAAADPRTSSHEAALLAAAYWPHICVMSTLLDSLIDYEHDEGSGEFSFVSHYPDHAAAQAGLLRATRRSLGAVGSLPHGHTHTMIVCGVAGYYAAAATSASLAARLTPGLVAALGPTARPILVMLRARRRLRSRSARDGAGAASVAP